MAGKGFTGGRSVNLTRFNDNFDKIKGMGDNKTKKESESNLNSNTCKKYFDPNLNLVKDS